MYVCHPFLVHAAQAHRGTRHRFLAQPAIELASPLDPFATGRDPSPVERAIRRSLTGIDGMSTSRALRCGRGRPGRVTGPGGIHARLEDAGHTLDHLVEEVTARMPTTDERRRLELPDGVPVLVVVRTAYDTRGVPVEVCDTVEGCAGPRAGVRLPRTLRAWSRRSGAPA